MRYFFSIRYLVTGTFFLFILFQAFFSYSAEDDQTLVIKEKITIVRGNGNYPPLEMVINGRLTGLHIDMIRHVAYQLDIELEFVSLPWGRAIQHFAEGKFDAISYYGYTEEREIFSYYHQNNILSDTRWVFLALEDRKHEFNFDHNLSGLDNLVIGVQHGYSHGKRFDSMKHLNRDVVMSEFDLERMLKKGRHDLAMMSYQEFLGFKDRGDFDGIVALSPSIDSDPQYIAFSRTKDEVGDLAVLTKLFAEEFHRFKASEEYDELLKSYDFYRYK
jgi:polar amino acid transport system substrate-binding protein